MLTQFELESMERNNQNMDEVVNVLNKIREELVFINLKELYELGVLNVWEYTDIAEEYAKKHNLESGSDD